MTIIYSLSVCFSFFLLLFDFVNMNVNSLKRINDVHFKMFIIIIIYFENVHFFHVSPELDVCPYEAPPVIPEHRPSKL